MKKILALVLSLFVVSMTLSIFAVQMGALFSEPPVLEWDRTYGGVVDDVAWSVVQTNDGGYALAGWTESFGAGNRDFWLVKTDSAGNMQWNKTYGESGRDDALCVVHTSDGGYALAGYTNSIGAGEWDFWLVKTNSTGHMQWSQTYGGTEEDLATSVIQACDGGYIIAGTTQSFATGFYDMWLVKTDPSGNMEWNKTYNPGSNKAASGVHSIIRTCDGGYALAGALDDPHYADKDDFLLVKTDANGNMQWHKTYGGAAWDITWSVAQTGDGGYALAGWTESFGAGGKDAWLIKLAPQKIASIVDIDPDTLNLKTKGKWITAYIELPEDYDVNDINVSTIMLNSTFLVGSDAPTEIGDYDNDGISDLMVKFDRAEVISYILGNLEGRSRTVTLTVTGKLYDGTAFQGNDTIRMLVPHPNGKGKVFDF